MAKKNQSGWKRAFNFIESKLKDIHHNFVNCVIPSWWVKYFLCKIIRIVQFMIFSLLYISFIYIRVGLLDI